ncbi:hypothetical protein AVEN_188746-1 [Araneus ventricosus]|uniref:Uncharacterized protein n=1 Tax=Araneus ventricosus TaxID=182803 RepID=A0A4Y2U4K8_ARAVE|nr:hypothetical protein AVEN_188746-1 [Araneus ventricosus]
MRDVTPQRKIAFSQMIDDIFDYACHVHFAVARTQQNEQAALPLRCKLRSNFSGGKSLRCKEYKAGNSSVIPSIPFVPRLVFFPPIQVEESGTSFT